MSAFCTRTTWLRTTALTVAVLLLAVGCSDAEEPDSAAPPTDAGAEATQPAAATETEAESTEAGGDETALLEGPTVAMTSTTQPSYVNTRYGPNTFAQEFGLDFSDDNFIVFDSHATATQTALSGRADIVGGSLVSHLLVREAGQDFQIFCPFVSNDDFVLVGRNGIDSVDDLFDPETRVAVDSPGGAGDIILNALLAASDAEGSVQDLPNATVLESSGGRTTAYAADEVDVSIIHLPQYNQAAAEIEDPVIIASLYEDVPVFIKEAFAAPAEWLEQNQDQAVAFCASVLKANQQLPQDFETYREAVDTYVEEPPEEEELREVFGLIQEYDFWPEDGGLSDDALTFMAETAVQSGVLQEVPDVSEVINRDVLDAAVEMASSS